MTSSGPPRPVPHRRGRSSWIKRAADALRDLDDHHLRRSITDVDSFGVRGRLADGLSVTSFASNDYLGLTTHPSVIAAAREALERWGTGAGSARLIAGARPIHSELEGELAEWKGADRALLFSSGFAANVGVLTALADESTLICSDRLNHASIVDGCRASKARVTVYPHRDHAALERLLKHSSRSIVVTERVFSMDGDVAPVREIAALCARHDALLVVDEAHSLIEPVDQWNHAPVLHVGTLSKTLASSGGFVAGPASIVDLLVTGARTFVFTTAAPPSSAAAALAALRIVRSREGEDLKHRLRRLVDVLDPRRPSPIIPFVFGREDVALAASARLLRAGLLVPAIRPPTVPAGTSRLRVSLSAAHTEQEVRRLGSAVQDLGLVAEIA